MLGVTVSGGSRIYKRRGGGGGHKIMDACCYNIITKTTRWEVVKNSASQKRPFFFFGDFVSFFPFSEHFHISSPSKANFFGTKRGTACT